MNEIRSSRPAETPQTPLAKQSSSAAVPLITATILGGLTAVGFFMYVRGSQVNQPERSASVLVAESSRPEAGVTETSAATETTLSNSEPKETSAEPSDAAVPQGRVIESTSEEQTVDDQENAVEAVSTQNQQAGTDKPANENASSRSGGGGSQSSEKTLQQLAKSKNLRLGKSVDLIALFQSNRHVTSGSWTLQEGTLVSGKERLSSFVLPYELPDNYVMRLKLKVLDGGDGLSVRVGLQGHDTLFMLNGWHSTVGGLNMLDGMYANNPRNETHIAGRMIGSQKRSEVVILNHETSIQVTIDGKSVLNWRGDPKRLSMTDAYKSKEFNRAVVFTYRTSWEISEFTIAPILADTRLAVPDEDEFEKAQNELEKSRNLNFRVTRRDEKLPFAQKLRALIVAENDPNHRYVLYSHALTNASEAGDLKLSLEIAENIAGEFNLSASTLKQQAITAISKTQRDPLAFYQLALISSDLSWEAVDEHRYSEGLELLDTTMNLAKKSRVRPLITQLAALSDRFEIWNQAYDSIKQSHEAVNQGTATAADHLAWGKFLCLVLHDWEAGLPHLKQGEDRELAKLAAEEWEQPKSFQPVVQLVRNWLELAQQYSGEERDAIESHARQFSMNAIPLAEDNQLPLIHQYARELFEKSALYDTTGHPEGVLIGGENANPPAEATLEFWVRTVDTRGGFLLKREAESNDSIGIFVKNGTAVLHANGSFYRTDARSGVYVSDGQWHHLAITKVGNYFRLFVDGVPVTELTPRAGFPKPNKSQWRLGNHKWIRDFQLTAQFARIRISGVSRYHARFVPERDYKADRATLLMLE